MISEEAVEAAAKAMWETDNPPSDMPWPPDEKEWDDADVVRETARAGLEAALPALRLAILREEIGLGDDWQIEDPRISYVDVQVEKETYLEVHGGRE